MSENQASKITSAEIVADFLRNNPEFFNEHPELLEQLRIPHPTGSAVSLVERQMSLLRERNEKTRQKLDELIEIARANEELASRMHMLALTLMDAHDPKEIFSILYTNLKKNFHADVVVVRVFATLAFLDKASGGEFVGDDLQGYSLFKTIIKGKEPVCGRLKRQQQVYLFDDEGDRIMSAVMVPLHGDGWGGVMAIGSHDEERFQAGMGVELLANLGQILSIILKPWVASR